jgi:hypothetical protein
MKAMNRDTPLLHIGIMRRPEEQRGDTMLKGTGREAAAEFLGTFILIAFGVGVVAQTVLSRGQNGSYLAINLGWGLGVMLGVYAAGGVSGAHLNPAVTLALAVTRGFAWAKVAPYMAAQVAGALPARPSSMPPIRRRLPLSTAACGRSSVHREPQESLRPIHSRSCRSLAALSIRSSERPC